jgi:peroxiredoxin
MGLPTFWVEGRQLNKRLVLIVCDGVVERVFYPVMTPDHHAEEVVAWVKSRPRSRMSPLRQNRLP